MVDKSCVHSAWINFLLNLINEFVVWVFLFCLGVGWGNGICLVGFGDFSVGWLFWFFVDFLLLL